MLGKNLSNMSLEDLQKAVMGGNPSIEPYQALAAIEKMVKGQKAQIAQTAQQQAPQGMVAQRTLAEAAALRNPYMASGLGAAPVASPVTSQMGQAPQGMAGGGMVSFQEGGHVPSYSGQTDGSVVKSNQITYAPYGYGNTTAAAPTAEELAEFNRQQKQGFVGNLSDFVKKVRDVLPSFDASQLQPQITTRIEGAGFEAKIAKSIEDLESTTGRKLSDGAKDALRQQEMAKMLKGSKSVQSTANMATPDTVKSDKSGLPSAAAARASAGAGGAGTGSRGAANVGLGAAAGRGGYEFDFPKAQTTDERLAEIDAIKGRMGAKNAEYLKPMQEQLDKYSEDAKANKKNSVGDALLQAGLGMMAGKSQHAFQNIGEGGAAGLAAYRDSKKLDQAAQDKLMAAQNDMAKSRIALEKGDETAALTFANQGRQEMKDRATLQLQAQYYAGSNAAQMAQANAAMARVNALGGTNDDKHMIALTRVRSVLNQDPEYKELAKMAAFKGTLGDNARTKMAEIERKLYSQIAPSLLTDTGGNTMPTSPAGGGGGAKFLGFE